MRTAALALLLLSGSACAEPFTVDDWKREAAFAALTVMDWQQTHDIARHPGMFELNPLLGRHPSAGRIDRYFAASLLAHVALARILAPQYRVTFQRATIVAEAVVVGRNTYLGLRVQF